MSCANIKNIPLQQLTQEFQALGIEGYRARQVRKWLYQKDATSFDEMTNIARKTRDLLKDYYEITRLTVLKQLTSTDGTIKYVIGLRDGLSIEAVWIPAEGRSTLCVSSQVGCAMGCAFCLTATMGFVRHLEVYEILEQVMTVRRTLPEGQGITNLVFMGMGEPLANTANLYPALEILIDPECFDFSKQHVTVSTCGLADEIQKFGDRTNAKLAISLNATTDVVRSQIMPINKKFPLDKLLSACRSMKLANRDRITFEYVMLKDVNDTMDDAKRLAKLLANMRAKINLLPFNEYPKSHFKRPLDAQIISFQNYLINRGIVTVIRKSRGTDICGACGQLVVCRDVRPDVSTIR